MIADGYSEDLFIDYKTSNTKFPTRSLDRFDKKNLAKALSGFGNGDGGIIIWGVVCSPTDNGDIPTAERLLNDANAFKSLLDGEIGGLTTPQHSRTQNVAIPDGTGPTGFVVTHIPAGFDLPFHSNHLEARGYYMRAGSSFHQVTPGLLAGMFGRKPNAEFSMSATPVFEFNPGGGYTKIKFEFSVRNVGRGMGRGLYLRVNTQGSEKIQYYLEETEHWTRLPSSDHRWVLSGIGSNVVLPPGVQINVFKLIYIIEKGREKDLDVIISVGSEGGLGAEDRLIVPAETLFEFGTAWTDEANRQRLGNIENISRYMLEEHQKSIGSTFIKLPSKLKYQN